MATLEQVIAYVRRYREKHSDASIRKQLMDHGVPADTVDRAFRAVSGGGGSVSTGQNAPRTEKPPDRESPKPDPAKEPRPATDVSASPSAGPSEPGSQSSNPGKPLSDAGANKPPQEAKPAWLTGKFDAVVPNSLVPVIADMQPLLRRTDLSDNESAVIAFVCLAPAIMAGTFVCRELGAHWIVGVIGGGIAWFLSAMAVIMPIMWLFITRPARRATAALAKKHGLDAESALELLGLLDVESRCFKHIQARLGEIDGAALSDDISVRISEAMVLALVKTSLGDVLAPSRDLAEKRKKLDAERKIVNAAADDAPLNSILSTGKAVYETAKTILDNREKMFRVMDKLAA